MDEKATQEFKRLESWFKFFLTVAILGAVLCLFFGLAPGFLTIISIVFAIGLKTQMRKMQQPKEKNLEDSKSNRRALIFFGIFMALFFLVAIVGSFFSQS